MLVHSVNYNSDRKFISWETCYIAILCIAKDMRCPQQALRQLEYHRISMSN